MNFKLRKNRTLRRLSGSVYARLGPNIYLIMGIMAVLFVFSGLVVGLLGRGWLVAWLFVLLGLLLGFWPSLRFLMGEEPEEEDVYDPRYEYYAKEEEVYADEPGQEQPAVDPKELDEIIADLQRRLEAETKRREEEKKRSEEEMRARAEEAERLRKLLREEQQRQSKEKERRRRNEENSSKWNKSTGKRVYKAGKVAYGNGVQNGQTGYFAGINNSEDLRRRYKELVKLHHPDNGGSAEEMNKVMKEYKELELFFRSYEKHAKKRS